MEIKYALQTIYLQAKELIMFIKRSFTHLVLLITLSLAMSYPVHAGSEACRTDIKSVIKSYEKALNASDVDEVIKNYSDDGVFMPSGKPTAVGRKNVITAYQHVFKALDLNVNFHIDEIIRQGDLAFVRTTSDGKIKLLDKNITIKNNSRELFFMKRIDGDWKIYRYMFNEMNKQ